MNSKQLLIEGYVNSELSPELTRYVNAKLKTDINWQREYLFRKELNSLGFENDVERLRVKMQNVMALHENQNITIDSFSRKSQIKKVIYAAAAITGIAFGSWFILSDSSQQPETRQLFKENLEVYPPIMVYRDGVHDNFHKNFMQSFQLLKKGNYTKAAIQFEVMLINNPNSNMVRFYLAISYLYLEEYEKSIYLFDHIIESETIMKDQANWYKGLAYLALNNTEMALRCLSPLKEVKGSFGDKATRICEKIERINNE